MADMIILMFVFFFALALLGFPIAYSLGFAVIAPLLITGNLTLNTCLLYTSIGRTAEALSPILKEYTYRNHEGSSH